MSPKRVDPQEKRRQIAEAALRVFSRESFQQSRIQDIADEADVGKGTIYEYFRNKEEIVQELFEQKFQQVIPEEQGASGPSPLEALLGSIRETFALSEDQREFNILWFEVLSSKVVNKAHPINRRMHELFDSLRAMYERWITEGQKRGAIRTDIDAEGCAGSIVASLDGIILHTTLFSLSAEEKSRRQNEFIRMTGEYLSPAR